MLDSEAIFKIACGLVVALWTLAMSSLNGKIARNEKAMEAMEARIDRIRVEHSDYKFYAAQNIYSKNEVNTMLSETKSMVSRIHDRLDVISKELLNK